MTEEEKQEQVTITFGGYDDTEDNTISIEGPINIYKIIDHIDDLGYIDLSPFKSGDNVVIYVRNINKTESNPNNKFYSGEIPYRGSFYKYDWDKSGWQQIALGNHSHANMELLDQLGNLDTDSLPIGAKKVITLEKTDPDNEGNIRTHDYTISFEDQKELPDIPVDAYGKNLYLTADESGKFEWKNTFVPAQTFKLLKITVSSEFALPDDANKNQYKTILLNKDYLEKNEVLFNTDLHDEILVFDNGQLISDLEYRYSIDTGLKLTINNDKPNEMFDDGENILIMIVRNGIAGLIDTIENQYMTKKEAIDLLSDGTISLNSYPTKKEMIDYAARKRHDHPEYLRRDEYDAFDFRYADYQHTHAQYITRKQVDAIILDNINNGVADPDKLFQGIVDDIQKELDNFRANYYDQKQVRDLIDVTAEHMSHSGAITVDNDGRSLTEYLDYLNKKENNISSVDTDQIELNSFDVQVGTDTAGNPNYIGGYKTGDVIAKGTRLSQFLKKLVQQKIPEKLYEPELKYDYSITNNDTGANAILKLTPHFIQNDAGDLTSLSLYIYQEDERPADCIEHILNNNEEFNMNLSMVPFDETQLCYNIDIKAVYEDGREYENNLSDGTTTKINGGELNIHLGVYSTRKCYFGSLPIKITDESLIDNLIYQYSYTAKSNPLIIRELTDFDLANGITLNFMPETAAQSFIFAIPEIANTKISGIKFLNQNYDILDDFTKLYGVEVPDMTDNLPANINNFYTVYYFNLTQPIQADMTFKILFKKLEE